MKNRFLLFALAFIGVVFSWNASLAQVDADASDKTKTLYANLKLIQNSGKFLFGQEFFNSFRYSSGGAHGDETYSDCFAVTGAHPTVLGTDFHYYIEKSVTERGYHTEAVKWAYEQGFVITCDWHISARNTTSYEYSAASASLVNNIVNDLNGDRAWFLAEVDKVIGIINNDFVVNGEKIPVVFRPLHEMNGGWFWWGSSATTSTNYKALYQLLVNYVKERTTSVLFAWTPNTPATTSFSYYPGDEYVDVLGVDIYEVNSNSLRTQLASIVDYAQGKGKVAVLSETGNRTNAGTNPGDNAANYWKNSVLPAILDDPSGKSKKIAWVLTWINASWSYPYVPHATSSAAAKQNFTDFKKSPSLLFSDKLPAIYTTPVTPPTPTPTPTPDPDPVTVSIFEDTRREVGDIELFPVPARDALTIRLRGFSKQAKIDIRDTKGKLITAMDITNSEIRIDNITEIVKPGLYLLRATDQKKSVTKKFLVN